MNIKALMEVEYMACSKVKVVDRNSKNKDKVKDSMDMKYMRV